MATTLVLTTRLVDGTKAIRSPLSPVPLTIGAGEYAGAPASAFYAPETIETLEAPQAEEAPFTALQVWEMELDGIGIVDTARLKAHLDKCPDPVCDTAVFLRDQLVSQGVL